MTPVRLFLGLLVAGLFAGCQTNRPLYYWGNYEPQAYHSYVAPGKVSAAEQIEKLKEDLAKGSAAKFPAHPGLHAHLGYLYIQVGKPDLALREFELEKQLFPESATFIDGLVARAKAPASQP